MQPKLKRGKKGTITINLAGMSEGVRTVKKIMSEKVNDTTLDSFLIY